MTFHAVEIDEVYARVRSFELQYQDGGEWKTFYRGATLGKQFSATFDPITTQRVRLNVLDATDGPTITEFRLLHRPK